MNTTRNRNPLFMIRQFFQKLWARISDRFHSIRKAQRPADREAFTFRGEVQDEHADRYAADVMVGTLRTAEQLQYTLETNRYYVPAQFVIGETAAIRRIALYEEGIGTEPGIRIYGEVVSVQTLARREIPVPMRPETDPVELYHLFSVKSWQPLPHPILILDTYRGRPRFTGSFLLEHCTRSYQLFVIRSDEDYRLMQLLNRAVDAMYLADSPTHRAEYSLNDEQTLLVTKEKMTILDVTGHRLDHFPTEWLLRNPKAGFFRIQRLTNKYKKPKQADPDVSE